MVTGAASVIGLATRKLLESSGHRVIGVDLRDVEAVADLSTRSSRAEMLGGAGIRLNAVAPGLISTPMTADCEEAILAVGDSFPVPMERAGIPEEVAGLLAYLLSPDASFFCGLVVFMDAGTEAALRGDEWSAPLTP